MKKDFILNPRTSPNYAKFNDLRGKLNENEWKFLLFVLKDHDILSEASTKKIVLSYVVNSQLAEYYDVDHLALKKKLRNLKKCQLDALCTRVYSYWNPDISYFKVKGHEFIPVNNLLAEPPSEENTLDFCKF